MDEFSSLRQNIKVYRKNQNQKNRTSMNLYWRYRTHFCSGPGKIFRMGWIYYKSYYGRMAPDSVSGSYSWSNLLF